MFLSPIEHFLQCPLSGLPTSLGGQTTQDGEQIVAQQTCWDHLFSNYEEYKESK